MCEDLNDLNLKFVIELHNNCFEVYNLFAAKTCFVHFYKEKGGGGISLLFSVCAQIAFFSAQFRNKVVIKRQVMARTFLALLRTYRG